MAYTKNTFPDKITGGNPQTVHNQELWFGDVNELKTSHNDTVDKLLERDHEVDLEFSKYLKIKQAAANGTRFFIIDEFGNVIISDVSDLVQYLPGITEVIIQGALVLLAGKTDLLNFEVNDKFRYWNGNEYFTGVILDDSAVLPADLTNPLKIEIDRKISKDEAAFFSEIDLLNVSGAQILDFNSAGLFKMNVVDDVTLSYTNFEAYKVGKVQSLEIIGAAGKSINWTNAVDLDKFKGDDIVFDGVSVNHIFLLTLSISPLKFHISNIIQP